MSLGVRRRVYPDVDQVVLRSLVVLGAMLPMVAGSAAGGRPSGWAQSVVLLLALVTAARPESVAGVGMLLGSAGAWSLAPRHDSALVLVAAGGLVLAHVAALLAAQGPARMHVDPRQGTLWGFRAVALWLAAAAVWGLAVLLDGAPPGRLVYAGGLAVLTGLAVLATWLLGVRRDQG